MPIFIPADIDIIAHWKTNAIDIRPISKGFSGSINCCYEDDMLRASSQNVDNVN